jgi:hypothetical protein
MSYGVKADVSFDDGSLTLPGEAEVTMRVVPDYGYQVTSVNGGGNFVTTDDGVSEFTVVVHHGEAGYFQAEVTKVANEVKTNSGKVSAGTVSISNDEIDSGTVRLYVDDVELSSDKIKGFENAAGDYTISNYLDINLSQIFYKGDENGDDVWDEQIHHLNKNATITLKLAEGIDVNDIVIVHNIDNGDQYEIIEIESYNPKTRVIKFRTKSFSNYAIAFKNSSKTNPPTGDNIYLYIALLGLTVVGLYTKKKRFN